jgi:hypothetical protein
MIEIRFDKTKDEVALLIWFLVDHSVFLKYMQLYQFITRTTCMQLSHFNTCQISSFALLRALLRWSLYVSHFQPYDLSNIELLTCV